VKTILHIITSKEDALPAEIIRLQGGLPECPVESVNLTEANPDYAQLVRRIFATDSVAVW
jgi:hypothetical protein